MTDDRVCFACDSNKTTIRTRNNQEIWFLNRPTDLVICSNCNYQIFVDKERHHERTRLWGLKNKDRTNTIILDYQTIDFKHRKNYSRIQDKCVICKRIFETKSCQYKRGQRTCSRRCYYEKQKGG